MRSSMAIFTVKVINCASLNDETHSSKFRSVRLMMQANFPTLRTISWVRRLIPAAAALGLLLVFAQTASAQAATPPLGIFKNYFVTGDYVVAGWSEGASDGSGFASGTISVPDLKQPSQSGVPASVPAGADIVAAYLYWATVESNQSSFAGQNGFFNNYPISGTVLGNPNAPTSWSTGGCSGSAQGTKTIRTYRADVRPYLPVDTNTSSVTFGNVLANGNFAVRLADSGSNGNTTPFTLGATLVIIYRVLAPTVPLNSIVLYDGAFAPSNSSQNFSQNIMGFYQAATTPVAKITHIVGNGQLNKFESVLLNNVNLPSLYGNGTPPFPGKYNGSWDNPTWLPNSYLPVNMAVQGDAFQVTTSVTPSATNSGCVDWGAVVFSTPVKDSDGDGLLDVWEDNKGYTDTVSGKSVALPNADKSKKDIFVEVDYLSTLLDSGSKDKHSHLPKQSALDMTGDAFAAQGINVHFDVGPSNYQGACSTTFPNACPDPYIIQSGTGGNAIFEGALLCTDSKTTPPCQFPGQPAIGWKGGLLFVRDNASVPNSDPAVPLGNFQPGRGLSYRYALFGHSLGEARSFWSTAGSAFSDPGIPKLVSIVNSGTTATVTLQSPVGVGVINPGDCSGQTPPAACSTDKNLDRITVSGALGESDLNGTYIFKNLSSSTNNNVVTTTFTITTASVGDGKYAFNSDPTTNTKGEPQLSVSYLGP